MCHFKYLSANKTNLHNSRSKKRSTNTIDHNYLSAIKNLAKQFRGFTLTITHTHKNFFTQCIDELIALFTLKRKTLNVLDEIKKLNKNHALITHENSMCQYWITFANVMSNCLLNKNICKCFEVVGIVAILVFSFLFLNVHN